jgi:nucleoside-diphosphate-sugar epimerase
MLDLGYENIFITGANGWFGRNLVHSLVNEVFLNKRLSTTISSCNLYCLVEKSDNTDFLRGLMESVTIVRGDIRNKEDCVSFVEGAKNSLLIHAAGVIHPKNVKTFYDVNYIGINHLLSAAVASGVKRVVAISSNSPCGINISTKDVFDELSEYNPYMSYGKSKMMMEQSLLQYYQQGLIEVSIIRAPWFYGPFQPERQVRFYQMVMAGRFPVVGSGENLRSMVYVDNLTQGVLLAAIDEHSNGEIYWVADEVPYSLNFILDVVGNVLKEEFGFSVNKKRLSLPHFVGDAATLVDAMLQKMGLYNQEIHVASEINKNIFCTVDKAKEKLGYVPQYSLRSGMIESVKDALPILNKKMV